MEFFKMALSTCIQLAFFYFFLVSTVPLTMCFSLCDHNSRIFWTLPRYQVLYCSNHFNHTVKSPFSQYPILWRVLCFLVYRQGHWDRWDEVTCPNCPLPRGAQAPPWWSPKSAYSAFGHAAVPPLGMPPGLSSVLSLPLTPLRPNSIEHLLIECPAGANQLLFSFSLLLSPYPLMEFRRDR